MPIVDNEPETPVIVHCTMHTWIIKTDDRRYIIVLPSVNNFCIQFPSAVKQHHFDLAHGLASQNGTIC